MKKLLLNVSGKKDESCLVELTVVVGVVDKRAPRLSIGGDGIEQSSSFHLPVVAT